MRPALPRMLSRGVSALELQEHLSTIISSCHCTRRRRGFSDKHLATYALLCRQCHNAVHSNIDEATLASSYATVERLLEHEGVWRFCAWASKQKGRNPRDVGLRVKR